MQEFMDVVKGRRSVRKYEESQVTDDKLETVLEAVKWAPSCANTQCWSSSMTHFDGKNTAADIFRYHEETKHHFERYARSAEYMDWENQPNPFRFYEKTRIVELPLLKTRPPGGRIRICTSGTTTRCREFTIETIAGVLELSLGLVGLESRGSLAMVSCA